MKRLFLILALFLAVSIHAKKITAIETNKLQIKVLTAKPTVNPPAGSKFIYPKNDGYWYALDSAGVEVCLNPLINAETLGLGNIDNTSDANKPISTAQQAALDAKQNSLGFTPVPDTRTVNGHALNENVTVSKNDIGLGNVTNESKATMFTSPVFTGVPVFPTPFTLGGVSVTVTGTEINYSSGLTSNIQAQLDSKGSGSGDVVGPVSSTNNSIPRFDGTTGKLIKGSGATISDNGKVTIPDNASEGAANLTARSAEPSAPAAGDIYLDDGTNTASGTTGLRHYTGTEWEDISGGTVGNEVSGTFTDADLTAGVLTIPHIYGDWKPSGFSIYDNNGDLVPFADRMTPGIDAITIDFSSFGTLPGTWSYYAGDAVSGAGGGSSTFLGLSDTPSSYSGQAGKYPKVNAGETGLEFTDAPSGGSGDVVGPVSSTANSLVQFDGTTGKLLKDGPAIGTGASNIVQLDGSAKLPAVDGSQLTGISTGSLPSTALGTSGAQTINRATSDKWTLTPSAAVTLSLSGFTADNNTAIFTIANGGTNISWVDAIKWDKTDATTPPTLQTFGYDIIRIIRVTDSKYIGEHVGTYDATLVTSYSNTGGQGNRTSIITVTTDLVLNGGFEQDINKLVDGNTTSEGFIFESNITGKYIEFEFNNPVFIDESILIISAGTPTQGTWKWQVRNNVGDAWLDASSPAVLDDTAFTLDLVGGLYKYYRLLGVSGTATQSAVTYEIEFKIAQ